VQIKGHFEGTGAIEGHFEGKTPWEIHQGVLGRKCPGSPGTATQQKLA